MILELIAAPNIDRYDRIIVDSTRLDLDVIETARNLDLVVVVGWNVVGNIEIRQYREGDMVVVERRERKVVGR